MGKAKSLRGGALVLTPLLGVDGQVYAMAQGNLAVGGLGVYALWMFGSSFAESRRSRRGHEGDGS